MTDVPLTHQGAFLAAYWASRYWHAYRRRASPPWWWKPWLTPWSAIAAWWHRDRPSERNHHAP